MSDSSEERLLAFSVTAHIAQAKRKQEEPIILMFLGIFAKHIDKGCLDVRRDILNQLMVVLDFGSDRDRSHP